MYYRLQCTWFYIMLPIKIDPFGTQQLAELSGIKMIAAGAESDNVFIKLMGFNTSINQVQLMGFDVNEENEEIYKFWWKLLSCSPGPEVFFFFF